MRVGDAGRHLRIELTHFFEFAERLVQQSGVAQGLSQCSAQLWIVGPHFHSVFQPAKRFDRMLALDLDLRVIPMRQGKIWIQLQRFAQRPFGIIPVVAVGVGVFGD